MTKFKNTHKANFLKEFPEKSLDDSNDDLSSRCKFNFSYFDAQAAGQDFCGWGHPELTDLLEKLREYSRKPLEYWTQQSVLVIYNQFPAKSEFKHPKHVPHQVRWGRFRIKQSVRLVGFVLPTQYHGRTHPNTGVAWDCNVFYVVFLDADHKFWVTERP
jgi:hypothetical protein